MTIGGSAFGLACLCMLAITAIAGTGTAAATETCPNAEFRDGRSTTLPECRVYEQVSPVNKNGNAVKSSAGTSLPNAGWSSPDGDTTLYNPAYGPSLTDPVRGFSFPQVSERTPEGWVNRPAANGPSPNAVVDGVTTTMINQLPSADRKSLLFVSASPFSLDNPNLGVTSGGANLARGTQMDWISRPTWAGANPAPGHLPAATFSIAGASADLSTAFFTSFATLTPEDGTSGRIGVDSYTNPDVNRGLYRWRDGELTNAAVLPEGTLDPWGAVMAGWVPNRTGSNGLGISVDEYGPSHSVSPDGSSWVFVSPDPMANSGRAPQLYLGRDGLPSVLLSTEAGQSAPVAGSSGVVPTGARAGTGSVSLSSNLSYAMRSKDGRFIVFTTADALTEDAPEDTSKKTYRYDVERRTLTYLPALTFSASSSLLGPVLRISDDGSRILYFNWETGVLGLWRADGLPVVISTTGTTSLAASTVGKFDSRFSSDGRTLVLGSGVPLRGEPDHPASQVEIYRYTEPNDNLDCISCPSAGMTPQGTALFTSSSYAASTVSAGGLFPIEETRGISDDGKRVFFHTTSPLLPDDHNEVADVYVWSEGSGLKLLSGGRAGSLPSYILDNDASGNNVFFVTSEGLDPLDTDEMYDLYDARVDGGFPEPLQHESCRDEDCQGPMSSPPRVTTPQSSTLRPGSTSVRHAATKARQLVVERSSGNGRRMMLRVTTAGPGKLQAHGSAVKPAARTVKRAGTYGLKLNLRPRARKNLSRKGRLQVKVKVRFKPSMGMAVTKTVKLTIKTNRKGN